jgi:hypothetical protein
MDYVTPFLHLYSYRYTFQTFQNWIAIWFPWHIRWTTAERTKETLPTNQPIDGIAQHPICFRLRVVVQVVAPLTIERPIVAVAIRGTIPLVSWPHERIGSLLVPGSMDSPRVCELEGVRIGIPPNELDGTCGVLSTVSSPPFPGSGYPYNSNHPQKSRPYLHPFCCWVYVYVCGRFWVVPHTFPPCVWRCVDRHTHLHRDGPPRHGSTNTHFTRPTDPHTNGS